MSVLVKQLEDKKKGCGKEVSIYTIPFKYGVCGIENKYCPICKAEIVILEQAIAEMQKQRQEILDMIDGYLRAYGSMMDWEQEQYEDIRNNTIVITKETLEQLNQPKTEK